MKNIDYSLYLVTDRNQPAPGTFEKVVEEALQGGATLVQLREKEGDTGLLYERAVKLKKITDVFHVPLIIDDRIDIMLASGADGVHVGQSDMPAAIARKLIGPDKILGVSAGTLEEAVQAEKDGADYLGVGAMFPTATKKDADITSPSELRRIMDTVHIPVVTIGGMNKNTIPLFKGYGLSGFAVVSAVMAADEPEKATADLKEMIDQVLGR
ncbi:thiamine phosphate synthase [uncultured Dialister sp.]|uniref:thiamine phosphate synthase n=1 Tax=uncultured Dialister sp. TaxID=278064 RepID=UPI0026369658|nr:thiamine phosphate synthase [uncultured Dialister sp.]